jgi:hypothetical protein
MSNSGRPAKVGQLFNISDVFLGMVRVDLMVRMISLVFGVRGMRRYP